MASVPETKETPLRVVRGKKGPNIRKWFWPVVFVAILILAYAWWRKAHANTANASLITATVTTGNLVETVSATGSVEGQTGEEVNIGSQITGVIKRLYADVGSQVKKGQIIAELDLPDLQANYQQSLANLADAQTKYLQQVTGVNQTQVQSSTALQSATAGVQSASESLQEAQAAAKQQQVATPTDIQKARTALASAQAALQTANATLVQTKAGANLQIQTAQEQLTQAQANAANSSANYARNATLYQQGYIAAATLDQAKATATVDQSLVSAAQQNVSLTEQKIRADEQTATDAVTQAEQDVTAAKAALQAAQSETYTTAQKQAAANAAAAALSQANQTLLAAKANMVNNALKQQDVQQARDAVNVAKAQVAYNQAQLNKSFIRSPINGTVLQLNAQQGETLAAGLAAPNIIKVANLSKLEIDAYVDETDIGKVKIGDPATCTLDAFPNQVFNGRVQKISSGSTIQQNVVTYDVTIGIADPQHELKPDMTANVTIQVGQSTNVLLVPSVAVQATTHGSTVNVLLTRNGQQQIKAAPVVTGGSDGVNTEIKSGLQQGETIVLAGANQFGNRRGPSSPFGPRQSGGGRGG